jgi:quercetin dioxygenase-like cupin family protein
VDPFAELSGLPLRQIWQSVAVRTVDGERLTLGVVELDANALVPEHRHDHEQLGMVLQGSVEFRVGDVTRRLEAGGTWCIPSNVPHEVKVGPEGAVVVDVFAPVREDWGGIEPTPAQREPRWPSSS